MKLVSRTWVLLALVAAFSALAASGYAQVAPLPTRGIEEIGRQYVGEPVSAFIGHVAMLFVTGKQPAVSAGTMQDTVDWVRNPLHSAVADGTGGLAVYAHPDSADRVLLLNGLTGMEVFHADELPSGYPYRDQMWDAVNASLYAQNKPVLWGFASDDTHYSVAGAFNFARNVSLVPTIDVFSLKAALRSGAFYTTNGPAIAGISVTGTSITITAAQSSEFLWLRAGQYNTGTSFTQGTTLGAGRAVKIQSGVSTSTLDVSALGLALTDVHYVRAIVRTSSTTYALTQPFVVSAATGIANPYPTSGVWLAGQSHNHDDTRIGGDSSRLATFRSNYVAVGQQASFETAYSYWEYPYQHMDSDGYPDIAAVSPGKVAIGALARLTVTGVNFADGVTVQLGPYPLTDLAVAGPTQLSAVVPASVPAGTYDLVVTTPGALRGTAANAVVVQAATADNAGWTSYQSPSLPWNQATSIASIGNEVWVGTMLGAGLFKQGVWSTFVPTGGLNLDSRSLFAIIADPAGGIWLSSTGMWFRNAAGAFPWTYEEPTNGATSERWGRLALDHAGQLWATSRWGEGIAIRNTSGVWTRWTSATNGLPLNDAQTIAADSHGNMWLGFNGSQGIWKWTGAAWQHVLTPAPVDQATDPLAIVAGSNGDMWVAVAPRNISYTPAQAGVVRFRDNGTTDVYQPPQLPQPRVTDILVTRSGDVWFASRGGVSRLDSLGGWQTFTAVNSGLVSDIVNAMAEDASGRVWFATANGVSSYAPFDFSLSNTGDIALPAAGSAGTSIAATLVAGLAQPVTFSAAGAPADVTAAFTSGSCTLNCSTTLNVTTTTTTAPGTYPLTVSGAAGGLVRTTTVVLTVGTSPPAAPSGLTATATSTSQITLGWVDNSGNETGFRIERSPDGITFAEIATTVTAGFLDTGLASATTYAYRVRSYNDGGASAYSNIASATTLTTPPSAPTGLTATATSSSQIALAWTDASTNETLFRIERSPDGITFTTVTTVGANITSYVDGALASSTPYAYRVRAENAGGASAYSNVASATTQAPAPTAPAAPTTLTAKVGANLQIALAWADHATNETGFQVERSVGSGAFTLLVTVAANVTTYVDTGLPRTVYHYRVRAYNGVGVSAYSNTATAKTGAK